jgi:cytochrome c-type biogenesis protein CcmH
MLVLVPGITLGVYLRIGQPGLPDLPLASRAVTPQNMDVASALQRIEQHLARNPDDGRGYEVVAPVYLRAGRFADAAFAYRRVIALLGPSATRHADLGEALVAEKDGIITAEARDAFEKAVALEPGYAKARFYLAVLLEQDGNRAGAVEKLTALAAELGTGPGRMRVEAEIARMRTETGGPAGEAGQSIAALPEAERQSAIRSMVDQLDARLSAGSGTLGEWQRLIRARLVLDEPDKAREALGRARAALAGEPDSLKVLDELAGEIPGKAP